MKSWSASIFVGQRPGYGPRIFQLSDIIEVCSDYCNKVKLCVTVTPTNFVYVDGQEPGAIVGLIQYPRFPKTEEQLRDYAINLGAILRVELGQKRVTIQMSEETITLD